MTIHIYDAMLVIRRELEKDVTGRAPRKIFTDMVTMPSSDVAIWCWDAPGSRKTRQQIFPEYKAKRTPHPDDIWPLIHLLKQCFMHTRAIQIEIPGFEADDIIGTLVRQYPQQDKYVHSTDGDLVQCFDGRTRSAAKAKVEPKWVRLYKTLVGDVSDNISGMKGFGPKSWDELSDNNKLMLQRALEQGDPRVVAMTAEGMLSKALANWVSDLTNAQRMINIWKIVGLLPVPHNLLPKFMKPGQLDFKAGDELLRKYKH